MIVYDGDSISSKEIVRLTGNVINKVIMSTGSDIFINLRSDGKRATKGFKIIYESGKSISLFTIIIFIVF